MSEMNAAEDLSTTALFRKNFCINIPEIYINIFHLFDIKEMLKMFG